MHNFEMSLMEWGQDMTWLKGNGAVSHFDGGPLGFAALGNEFAALQQVSPGVFEITTTAGDVYRFDITVSGSWPGVVHLLTRITDRDGRVTTLSYDGQNRLVAVNDPFGNHLTFHYDANDRLSTIMDPLGRITRLCYDAGGHTLLAIEYPDGTDRTYEYNLIGQLTRTSIHGECPFAHG